MARPRGRPMAEETRRALLRAAEEMYGAKGYAGTSFAALAEPLGLSGPAIYYHFDSKSKLLTEAYVARLSDIASLQRADTAEGVTVVAELWRFVYRHVRLNLDSAGANAEGHHIYAAVHLMREVEPPEAARLRKASVDLLDLLRSILQRGIEEGSMPNVTKKTRTATAFALLGLGNMVRWWFRADGELTAHEVAELYADLALGSVGAKPLRGKFRKVQI
jgi:AcrR family transcriptional regulator